MKRRINNTRSDRIKQRRIDNTVALIGAIVLFVSITLLVYIS